MDRLFAGDEPFKIGLTWPHLSEKSSADQGSSPDTSRDSVRWLGALTNFPLAPPISAPSFCPLQMANQILDAMKREQEEERQRKIQCEGSSGGGQAPGFDFSTDYARRNQDLGICPLSDAPLEPSTGREARQVKAYYPCGHWFGHRSIYRDDSARGGVHCPRMDCIWTIHRCKHSALPTLEPPAPSQLTVSQPWLSGNCESCTREDCVKLHENIKKWRGRGQNAQCSFIARVALRRVRAGNRKLEKRWAMFADERKAEFDAAAAVTESSPPSQARRAGCVGVAEMFEKLQFREENHQKKKLQKEKSAALMA